MAKIFVGASDAYIAPHTIAGIPSFQASTGLAPTFGFLWLGVSDRPLGCLIFDLLNQQPQVLNGPKILAVSRNSPHSPNHIGHEEFGARHLPPPPFDCRIQPYSGKSALSA